MSQLVSYPSYQLTSRNMSEGYLQELGLVLTFLLRILALLIRHYTQGETGLVLEKLRPGPMTGFILLYSLKHVMYSNP